MKQACDRHLELAHLFHMSPVDDYWQGLLATLPNGLLLHNPSGLGVPGKVELIHATRDIGAVREKQALLPGPGCLLSVVYAVPAKRSGNRVTMHNYGQDVFRHVDPSLQFSRLLIEADIPSAEAVAGISYLLLGDYYYELIHSVITTVDSKPLALAERSLSEWLAPHQDAIELMKDRYHTKTPVVNTTEAKRIINQIHDIANDVPVFAFALFEAVSQCLMLCSEDTVTTECTGRREPNNSLYISLVHDIIDHDFEGRFNAAAFNPSYDTLLGALRRGSRGERYALDYDQFVIATANQALNLVGGQVCRNDTSLLGHMLYMEAGLFDPDTAKKIQSEASHHAYAFWQKHGIRLVYNATTIKGEIGVCPGNDNGDYVISALEPTVLPGEFVAGKPEAIHIQKEEYHG